MLTSRQKLVSAVLHLLTCDSFQNHKPAAYGIVLIGLASLLYGTITSLYGAIVASMIYFAFVGAAAVIYAIRHHDLGNKIESALLTGGLLQVLVFSYLTYEFFAYPNVWGGNPLAYGYVAATFILGVLIYFISKSVHARKGNDISLAFKEIPPE